MSERVEGRERERETEHASARKREANTHSPRRAAFAKQLLWNRCLDDTHPRMRVRNADDTRAQLKSCARQFHPSPSPPYHHRFHHHHRHRHRRRHHHRYHYHHHHHRYPSPSPSRKSSVSLSLSHPFSLTLSLSLRPRPRGPPRRARARVNALTGVRAVTVEKRHFADLVAVDHDPAYSIVRERARARARFILPESCWSVFPLHLASYLASRKNYSEKRSNDLVASAG